LQGLCQIYLWINNAGRYRQGIILLYKERLFKPSLIGTLSIVFKFMKKVGAIVYKLLCCISLVFLSSCTLGTNTVPAPTQLSNLLKQNLVLLPDNNFEYLPSELKENEIIFLGETHKVKPLANAADHLVVYLANYSPVVHALESCYGFSPFMEAGSLGNPKTAKPIGIPESIQTFNSNQAVDKKILMTAIDVEHAIYHTKSDTVLFLQDLASRSTSGTASQVINKEVVQLTSQDTYDKMNRYLKNLEKVFLQHLDTFSPEDQDEILFSMELLAASNRYQYIRRGLINSQGDPYKLRYRYFKRRCPIHSWRLKKAMATPA
jgi:hypothetical protein